MKQLAKIGISQKQKLGKLEHFLDVVMQQKEERAISRKTDFES